MTTPNNAGPWGPVPQAYGAGPLPGQPVMTPRRKEPFLSLLASFFIPGLGTILNGETGKGVGIMALYFLGPILPLLIALFVASGFTIVVFLVALGAWIWGLVDAYKGAVEHNAKYGLL